jgi:hypothetical protein
MSVNDQNGNRTSPLPPGEGTIRAEWAVPFDGDPLTLSGTLTLHNCLQGEWDSANGKDQPIQIDKDVSLWPKRKQSVPSPWGGCRKSIR